MFEEKYSLNKSVPITCVWLAIITTVFIYSGVESDDFFLFGPSDAMFVNMKIENWFKWSCIMMYSFLSQFVSSYTSTTISPYVANVVYDHKQDVKLNDNYVMFIVVVLKLYEYVHFIMELFLTLCLQFQYYVPALLADLIITCRTTKDYLDRKTKSYNTI